MPFTREGRLIASTLLSWLGIYICLRVQAGFVDPHQTLCMDGGEGCAKVLHNPKFVLLGMHPHQWGEIFFSVLLVVGLGLAFFRTGLLARLLSIGFKTAAIIGLIAAGASLYAQYTLIHNICPLCFTLDCLLVLIALSALPGRFHEAADPSTDAGTVGGNGAPVPSSPFKFGNLLLVNLFGLAVLSIFIFGVKPGTGWEPPKVAMVDDEAVNLFELRWLASPLTYKQDLEIYPIQKQVLQDRINELLIEHAAKKEGKTVDAYLLSKKLESDPATEEGRRKKAELIAELTKSAHISNDLDKPTPQILTDAPSHGIPVGDPAAPIHLIVFSDFQCPYCRDAFPVIDAFLQKHPGEIFVLYCQFPLKELHPLATTAAMAGLCALQQGKYAEYHDLLYKVTDVQKGLSPEGLRDAAKQCGMDLAAYDKCLSAPETLKSVEEAITEAKDLGIPGIPSVYFNGKYINKEPSAKILDKLYEEAMKTKQGTPGSPVPVTP